MAEVSTVEWNHLVKKYIAIFSNGEECVLEADNLREAEREAERIADQTSFSSFTAPRRDYE
jgi:predicted kinase